MIFFGKVLQGKLIMSDLKIFNTFLANMKDCVVEIRIRKWRSKRSSEQNRLYWLWIGIMAKDFGYDVDELHASLRAKFLVDHSAKLPLVRSTTVLNKKEFTQYLNQIERLANEFGLILPRPEDLG